MEGASRILPRALDLLLYFFSKKIDIKIQKIAQCFKSPLRSNAIDPKRLCKNMGQYFGFLGMVQSLSSCGGEG